MSWSWDLPFLDFLTFCRSFENCSRLGFTADRVFVWKDTHTYTQFKHNFRRVPLEIDRGASHVLKKKPIFPREFLPSVGW